MAEELKSIEQNIVELSKIIYKLTCEICETKFKENNDLKLKIYNLKNKINIMKTDSGNVNYLPILNKKNHDLENQIVCLKAKIQNIDNKLKKLKCDKLEKRKDKLKNMYFLNHNDHNKFYYETISNLQYENIHLRIYINQYIQDFYKSITDFKTANIDEKNEDIKKEQTLLNNYFSIDKITSKCQNIENENIDLKEKLYNAIKEKEEYKNSFRNKDNENKETIDYLNDKINFVKIKIENDIETKAIYNFSPDEFKFWIEEIKFVLD